jgi:hypothetical protein
LLVKALPLALGLIGGGAGWWIVHNKETKDDEGT